MYLSAERIAVANKAIKDTFEQSSVAWQAIPHWDTGDPGQIRVRSDDAHADEVKGDQLGRPLGGESLPIEVYSIRFALTVAQAISPTPDALLDAVIARTVQLAGQIDNEVITALATRKAAKDIAAAGTINQLLNALIDARAKLEKVGYRAPSCLITNTTGLKSLNTLQSGLSDYQSLLDAANINSLHRVDEVTGEVVEAPDATGDPDSGDSIDPDATGEPDSGDSIDPDATGDADSGDSIDPDPGDSINPGTDDSNDPPPLLKGGRYLLLGRRQRIAHGAAAAAAAGEEPVDLAVSVPPSLEVVGETTEGWIEMAVRIRFAPRLTDKYGVVGVVIT